MNLRGKSEERGGRSTRSTHDVWVADALAEMLVAGVVREPAELVLHRLREWCLVNV